MPLESVNGLQLFYEREGAGRGHSQSGRAPVPGTAEQDAADLLALIERLGIQQPVAIGNSFGATITLKAVADAPEAFSAIIVHEPPLVGLIANDADTGEQVANVTTHFERPVYVCASARLSSCAAGLHVGKTARGGRDATVTSRISWEARSRARFDRGERRRRSVHIRRRAAVPVDRVTVGAEPQRLRRARAAAVHRLFRRGGSRVRDQARARVL